MYFEFNEKIVYTKSKGKLSVIDIKNVIIKLDLLYFTHISLYIKKFKN